MELLSDFLSWAWARHHNILSWYIRPMFILPYIFFAYKRSWKGLVITILALLTSMFWFPVPATVDPAVEQFLQAERDYILGTWTFGKILLTLTVPAFFYFPHWHFGSVHGGGVWQLSTSRRWGRSPGALLKVANQAGWFSFQR